MSWAVGISIISGWLVGLFTGLGKGEGGGVTMQHTTRSVAYHTKNVGEMLDLAATKLKQEVSRPSPTQLVVDSFARDEGIG